jgi:hypothetical protein
MKADEKFHVWRGTPLSLSHSELNSAFEATKAQRQVLLLCHGSTTGRKPCQGRRRVSTKHPFNIITTSPIIAELGEKHDTEWRNLSINKAVAIMRANSDAGVETGVYRGDPG